MFKTIISTIAIFALSLSIFSTSFGTVNASANEECKFKKDQVVYAPNQSGGNDFYKVVKAYTNCTFDLQSCRGTSSSTGNSQKGYRVAKKCFETSKIALNITKNKNTIASNSNCDKFYRGSGRYCLNTNSKNITLRSKSNSNKKVCPTFNLNSATCYRGSGRIETAYRGSGRIYTNM